MQHVVVWALLLMLSMHTVTLTPSLVMVSVLVSTGLIVVLLYLVYKVKMGALILSLIVIGGMFVLLSFVILSSPWDYSKVMEKGNVSVVTLSSFGCCFWPYGVEWNFPSGANWVVCSWYCVVFVFLILFLLISLGIFYSLVKISKGTSFGKF